MPPARKHARSRVLLILRSLAVSALGKQIGILRPEAVLPPGTVGDFDVSTPASLLPFTDAPQRETASFAEPAWRSELHARLRDHRQRRIEPPSQDGAPRSERRDEAAPCDAVRDAAARVAARVAERYRNAPTYQEVLAESAARAAQAAETAAEAAYEAHAAAQAVLSELRDAPQAERSASQEELLEDSFFHPHADEGGVPVSISVSVRENDAAFEQHDHSGQADERVYERVYEEAAYEPVYSGVEHHQPLPERVAPPARPAVADRARALVDAFAEAIVPAAQALPAKLIEFPRELIATRRQRPRIAEGPLREEGGNGLRIFEADDAPGVAEATERATDRPIEASVAAQDGTMTQTSLWDQPEPPAAPQQAVYHEAPTRQTRAEDTRGASHGSGRRRGGFDWDSKEPAAKASASPWGAIRLGEHPKSEAETVSSRPVARRPEHGYKQEAAPQLNDLAPVSDRCMAAIVDTALVSSSFLLFVLAFAATAPHIPMGRGVLAFGAFILICLGALYGWLFMSFGGGSTPGMRYARIALCTFNDANPTRGELQSRVLSTALALMPLGLGVVWAFLDEDRLGWQDRMTRTYQRSYR